MSNRYPACDKKDVPCKWRMAKDHGDFEYLNEACYLTDKELNGKIQCPTEPPK